MRGEFSPARGWTDIKVRDVIERLLDFLSKLDTTKYCHFACSLKMVDYLKLQAEGYQLDSAADLVASTCTDRITQWYFFEYKGLDLEAHYYFDQGEPFEEIIKSKWNRELAKLRQPSDYNQWS